MEELWCGVQMERSQAVWKQLAELPGGVEVVFLCGKCHAPITRVRRCLVAYSETDFSVWLQPVDPSHVGSRWIYGEPMTGGQRIEIRCRRCPRWHRAPIVADPLLSTLFLWGAAGDGRVVVPGSTTGAEALRAH